jgi:hypothetical protein
MKSISSTTSGKSGSTPTMDCTPNFLKRSRPKRVRKIGRRNSGTRSFGNDPVPFYLGVKHPNNCLAFIENASIIIDEKREGKPTKPERN